MKRPATEWEKIPAKYIFEEGFEFRVYEEHLQVNNLKSNNQLKKRLINIMPIRCMNGQ